MEGVSIVESSVLNKLIYEIQTLGERVEKMAKEQEESKSPFMNSKQVMDMMIKGKTWLNDNKQRIGFSKKGGQLIFKRSDVVAFMENDYFKVKT